MQANIAEAKAEMQRMEAKLANDTEIARSKRDFDAKKASYDVEVNTARAEAELAYELQVGPVFFWWWWWWWEGCPSHTQNCKLKSMT